MNEIEKPRPENQDCPYHGFSVSHAVLYDIGKDKKEYQCHYCGRRWEYNETPSLR